MIFMRNGTEGMSFITPVTDINCAIKSVAAFFHKILIVLVAGRAGSAFNAAGNDLAAEILLLAMEAVNTEVFCI